ncbi:hypothetical protein [Tenacibaculum dicentrarchi]|uniref:hypothetical protein n=1 Tax=Tenacibaculum dicentrarchi TaxID=669041 RepID=UPI00351350AE
MKEYFNDVEFKVKDNLKLKSNLKNYFESDGFIAVENEKDQLLFTKKSTLLDGWKLNILNWEAKINIEVKQKDNVVIHHNVKTKGFGFITPVAFSRLFEKYLYHLESYINNNECYKSKNIELIKLGKIKMLKYIALLILGIFTGLCLGSVLENMTGIELLGYLGIIIGFKGTEIMMNKYLIKKNTLQHSV